MEVLYCASLAKFSSLLILTFLSFVIKMMVKAICKRDFEIHSSHLNIHIHIIHSTISTIACYDDLLPFNMLRISHWVRVKMSIFHEIMDKVIDCHSVYCHTELLTSVYVNVFNWKSLYYVYVHRLTPRIGWFFQWPSTM